MTFKDHFSGHATDYAAFRPTYPPELFAWVAGLPAERRLAWDCATGSGQAAVALAEHFPRVAATDASAAQIAHAVPHPRVEYGVAPAEASGLADGSVDLVTVAQALHWFDFDRFYAEVRRVLAPGGALAVWSYDLARFDPAVDRLVHRLARDTVGPYWPPERRWVDEEYRTLPFPFAPSEQLPVPAFHLEERWDLARFAAYLRTWSAVVRFRAATGRDPVAELEEELAAAWGDPLEVKAVRWPLHVRAAREP